VGNREQTELDGGGRPMFRYEVWVCQSATWIWLRRTVSMTDSMLKTRRGAFVLVFGATLRGCVGTNCPSQVRSRQILEVTV
jgi:AMMECR1 domain-containing protein